MLGRAARPRRDPAPGLAFGPRCPPRPCTLPIRIAPSILSADFGRLAEEVRAIEAAGADVVHVDVMDGRFVPNITIGPLVVEAVRKVTKLPIDVHLMIVEPERYVEAFAEGGRDPSPCTPRRRPTSTDAAGHPRRGRAARGGAHPRRRSPRSSG